MVKKGTILGPRNPITKDGRPRIKPGRKWPQSDLRGERLVLRVHPDLQEILTLRAREAGMSRSAYCEQVIIGWAAADPRNPKIDSIGKFDPRAPSPAEFARTNAMSFAARWARFVQISEMLLGVPPKKALIEQPPEDYWPEGSDEGDHTQPNEDDEDAEPAPTRPPVGSMMRRKDEDTSGS